MGILEWINQQLTSGKTPIETLTGVNPYDVVGDTITAGTQFVTASIDTATQIATQLIPEEPKTPFELLTGVSPETAIKTGQEAVTNTIKTGQDIAQTTGEVLIEGATTIIPYIFGAVGAPPIPTGTQTNGGTTNGGTTNGESGFNLMDEILKLLGLKKTVGGIQETIETTQNITQLALLLGIIYVLTK